ncbi:MAG: NAD+ synthase, partial [Candidatus Latescibacteria bacterium]|nr:NAD+ synthase [Candidatus Latescibacterota bacterium]
MRIALAQINSTVGDIKGNTDKIIQYIDKARQQDVDLVVFPELAICGYPPKDLLLKKDFVKEINKHLKRIVKKSYGISVIVGTVQAGVRQSKSSNYDVSMSVHFPGYQLYNAAVFLSNGKYIGAQAKTYLPNYDIFDEQRYFISSKESNLFQVSYKDGKFHENVGITICEDIWVDDKPIALLKTKGADIIINISSSPFYINKYKVRKQLVRNRAITNKIPIFYCNLIGGQDDLVFDGGSFACNEKGSLIASGRRFEEDLIVIETTRRAGTRKIDAFEKDQIVEIYSALVLGLRDYVEKNGFNKVILGMSGGIDSALVACLAVEALGAHRVVLVIMPSKFTQESSIRDAITMS